MANDLHTEHNPAAYERARLVLRDAPADLSEDDLAQLATISRPLAAQARAARDNARAAADPPSLQAQLEDLIVNAIATAVTPILQRLDAAELRAQELADRLEEVAAAVR